MNQNPRSGCLIIVKLLLGFWVDNKFCSIATNKHSVKCTNNGMNAVNDFRVLII